MKQPYKEERPWGDFTQFTHNESTTVKIITVKPHEAFSLQYHNEREEFWRILAGSGTITRGDLVRAGRVGDEFYIEKKQLHRAEAGDEGLVFLEIAFGHFDEADIVRVQDKYGRK